jgi:hypothetical protein
VTHPNRGLPMPFLLATVANPPDGCVPWPYAKDLKGYGLVKVGRTMKRAHRLALKLHSGRDPDPVVLACHAPRSVCIGPACINPTHLRWDNDVGNAYDRIADGTHICGERHALAKLTENDVRAIRADPRGCHRLAQAYGVRPAAIKRIRNRRTWGHVT